MAPFDIYRVPGDLPPRIPVFPLRGVILLPRAELPLNIFEPRYLEMVQDVLSGSRILGIVQPENAAGIAESPSGESAGLKRTGCAGRLTAYQELNDGRLHVVLTGVARFELLAEAETEKAYRMAAVTYERFAADLEPDESAEHVDRAALLRVLKSYLDVRRLGADWKAIDKAPLEPLVNSLAAMSPFGPEEKQALLEAKNLEARADILIALAEMAIAAGGASGGGTLQ